MSLQLRQLVALFGKNIKLLCSRRGILGTLLTAILIPLIIALLLAVLVFMFFPKATFGVGDPHPVRNVVDAMNAKEGMLVLVNNASSVGGSIDKVMAQVAKPLLDAGKHVIVTNSTAELSKICSVNYQGQTPCFAGAVFQSSTTEGPGGIWNYVLRNSYDLGEANGDVTKDTNGAQYYLYPLQHAIDVAIASVESVRSPRNTTQLPALVKDWMFTSQTQEQLQKMLRDDVLSLSTDVVAVAWVMAFIGVVFKLVSFTTKEREMEMSDLIESMMPNRNRWEPQAIRLFSTFSAFTVVYLPGWLIAGVLMKVGLLTQTSAAIPIVTFLLGGMAMVSFSILGASFFRRASMSSIIVAGVVIILAIVAQIQSRKLSTIAMAITGLLFTPMTIVSAVISFCRWEKVGLAADFSGALPQSATDPLPWALPGFVFWIFLLIQILVYPILAAVVERALWGSATSRAGRTVSTDSNSGAPPVVVSNATKLYKRGIFKRIFLKIFRRHTEPVVAVDNLSLTALRGQIMLLVGANGCGKTTTLAAIAGFHGLSSGHITVDGSGGIGICPQKNVLWNSLTVEEHVRIFSRLKTIDSKLPDTAEDMETLIALCGLTAKRQTRAKFLSGGQKRKLQLLLMLIGDSRLCCVDEATGGLDPLSRRWIWDILLAERGKRTFLLTSHFLDEAEYLADHMVIMSKGKVKAEGSVTELKNTLGNGYRLQILTPTTEDRDLATDEKFDRILSLPDSASVLTAIKELEAQGITNYQISGPTIEEIFMSLAIDRDAIHGEFATTDQQWDSTMPLPTSDPKSGNGSQETETRRQVGAVRQAAILFGKRLTLLRRSPLPILISLLLPVITAACLIGMMKDVVNPGCELELHEAYTSRPYLNTFDPLLVIGPSPLSNDNVQLLLDTFPNATFGGLLNNTMADALFHPVRSWDEFSSYTHQRFANITPGGMYLGDAVNPPTFSVRSSMYYTDSTSGVFMQNILDVLITGVKIATSLAAFDRSLPPDTTDALMFAFFFSLVMCLSSALFALYPTKERVRNVRAMEYSNGVRPLPLWTAYTLFDTGIATASAILAMVIFGTTMKQAWFGLGYLMVVLLLYGVAAILLAYLISKIAKSAFSTFAMAAGGQVLMAVVFLSVWISAQARSDPKETANVQNTAYYVIGLISPITQLLKAIIVSLNLFSVLCQGAPPTKATNPGAFNLYGGPLMFLIAQIAVMFSILVWSDHRFSLGKLRKPGVKEIRRDQERGVGFVEREVADEEARVMRENDSLTVLHTDKVFKSFGRKKVQAVDDLTFGVKQGEIFALVGPNGAGKSTTISMLRGEIQPSGTDGGLYVQGISVTQDQYRARFHLGVCPQFDAIDALTVREHLTFYARIRGVKNIPVAVESMVSSVGLQPFVDRRAEKLSGGNKRKLSLAIALIGNPEVVLLDEPSSGMDPMAKRNMWMTLAKFRPGRSILLTTHSMEEADALASRVGIISKRLLDVGTTEHLRTKHGDGFHVHIVMRSAPHTSNDEMTALRQWMEHTLPGTTIEGLPYHGQLRFNVPIVHSNNSGPPRGEIHSASRVQGERSVASLFVLLEENKIMQGIEFYTVSRATLDEVFLKVIKKHSIIDTDDEANRRR